VRVRSLHPAVTAQQVRDATGFPLQVEDSTPDTPAPSTDELAYIRRADPEGFWTGQGKPAG
jgi:glutaconate CoA-transferase subunit B